MSKPYYLHLCFIKHGILNVIYPFLDCVSTVTINFYNKNPETGFVLFLLLATFWLTAYLFSSDVPPLVTSFSKHFNQEQNDLVIRINEKGMQLSNRL